jgi:hypothetical protein
MSFQIDLLHESERKVGSMATIKTAIQGIVLFCAGLLVLLVAQLSFAVVARNHHLRDMEDSWVSLERRQEMAKSLQAQMTYNEGTRTELEQWRETRLRLDQQLLALLYTTPAQIQIKEIVIEPQGISVATDAPVVTSLQRRFGMELKGRATGDSPLTDITSFKLALGQFSTTSNHIEKVSVSAFGPDDSTPEDSDDRSFAITISYPVLPES